MKKFCFSVLLGTALLASHSYGASIVAQATYNGLALANGTDLAQNNLVRIGYFNISDALITSNFANLNYLNSNFVEFGTAKIGQQLPFDGLFQSSVINRPNSDAEGFLNKQIYIWVLASTDNSSATASLNTAYQEGIYYMDFNAAGGANWKFKSTSDVPNDSSPDFSDLTGSSSSLRAGAHLVVGGFGVGTNDVTGGANFNLVAVPEPATTGLALLGGVALLLRRRRV